MTEAVKLTSEQRLGWSAVPAHQCPDIDYVVKAINSCEKMLRKHNRLDEDELRSLCDDIEYELSGLVNRIGDIRTACDGIRTWGQSWKDLCKEIAIDNTVELEDYA